MRQEKLEPAVVGSDDALRMDPEYAEVHSGGFEEMSAGAEDDIRKAGEPGYNPWPPPDGRRSGEVQ